MNIYHLNFFGWSGGYDQCRAMVVTAKNEHRAAALANERAGDEGRVWGNPEKVSCKQVGVAVDGCDEGVLVIDNINA